ncbi:MAG: outer membrane lipoprotein carrier protein LolA [Armatimonadota bacterium]
MNTAMTKTLLLAVGLAFVATLMAGCPRQEPAPTPAGPGPSAGGPAPSQPADVTGKTLAEALGGLERPQSFEATMTGPGGDAITMLVKDDYNVVRIKTDEGFMQMDRNEGVVYVYDADSNTVMKMSSDEEASDTGAAQSADLMEAVDKEAPIIGEEDIDGDKCWTVDTTVSTEGEAEQTKIWVLADSGLLRRAQTGDEVMDFVYSRINELTDADFAMPEGAEIQDMSALMP